MGVLRLFKCRLCDRRLATGSLAPSVCPISGQTSSTGVCPISGQTSTSGGLSAPHKEKVQLEHRGSKYGNSTANASSTQPPTEPTQQAAVHKERGNSCFRKGEHQAAVEAYSEALHLEPKDASLWLNRSIALRQLQRWEESVDDADRAIALHASSSKAYYSKATALQQLGRLPGALRACEAGLKCNPQHKALQELQGCVREQMGAERKESDEPRVREDHTGSDEDQSEEEHDDAIKCPASRLEHAMDEIKSETREIVYKWSGREPSPEERRACKQAMVGVFRGKYLELKARSAKIKSKASVLDTEQYAKEQKLGLQLQGGHRPMERPENVELPASYKAPLGELSTAELTEYGPDNRDRRYLLSVYGDVFDVSDRPDKYGPEGPYNVLVGKDITWGLFTGVDTKEYCNKFYDLHKAKDMGKDKMMGVCSWLAWYETEYGKPVGHLSEYSDEGALPAPPLHEMEDACIVM